MTEVINAIIKRASEPRLIAPAPDEMVLQKVFQCAARAPDHALLRPWRYLVIEGEGRTELGELFAQAVDDKEHALSGKQEKLRKSPLRAPMIIVGIVCRKPHPKVPDIEQHASAAVGLGYVLLALQSAGFGAMWRTGEVAYHPRVAKGLGLTENESIAGFLYVGTVDSHKPEVPRAETTDFVSRWPH